MTTIKVSMTTRDRLKSQAAAAHQSLGAYLDALADIAESRARMESMRLSIAATREADMASYLAESDEWDSVDGGR